MDLIKVAGVAEWPVAKQERGAIIPWVHELIL